MKAFLQIMTRITSGAPEDDRSSNVVSDAAAHKVANLDKGTILKAIKEFKDY